MTLDRAQWGLSLVVALFMTIKIAGRLWALAPEASPAIVLLHYAALAVFLAGAIAAGFLFVERIMLGQHPKRNSR
ncbi:hypothetical protein [Prosthecomicrobium sp. N25]|uniref:hypothetical protein n=1 Tax=Prosthecomicrobium sp. N25 TaxID=3129254 RepID=UPI0030782610